MDDTICDFLGRYHEFRKAKPEIDFPQSIPGFFENLEPIEGAIESVNALRQSNDFEVYILTAPSTRNPLSYTEKRLWVERHFDYAMVKRLILSPDKSLLRGDVLIDDYAAGKGQDQFEGSLSPKKRKGLIDSINKQHDLSGDQDIERIDRIKNHPDNGTSGLWVVSGWRHAAIVHASSAEQAIEIADRETHVDSGSERLEANLLKLPFEFSSWG